jgi:hypothetical protein
MSTSSDLPSGDSPQEGAKTRRPKRQKGRWKRWLLSGFGILLIMLVTARLAMPRALRWYVNRTLDRSQIYRGEIGDIDVSLWRGAYAIHDVRLLKITGNVPVPLFSAHLTEFSLEWSALRAGKLVGKLDLHEPELNFVDSESEDQVQTGAGGPWLQIIKDLYPFKINSARVHKGSIHFRAFDTKPPVDVYLSHLDASIENLTNIHDEITPRIATVTASALAMEQARLEYRMKLDPFSYRPTYELAVRLLGLDVTKTNSLARAYGDFDFEKGWFDLVVELNVREGAVEGYIKPIFRDLQVLSLKKDVREDNVLNFFWETLLGITTGVLRNPPRNQFATLIPLRGNVDSLTSDIFAAVGNVLRNAFIRAYLPRLEGLTQDITGLEWGKASIVEPSAGGAGPEDQFSTRGPS